MYGWVASTLCRLEPNAAELEAEDWDTGERVVLALDPHSTPMEQAEQLYKRARKLRRAVDAVQPLLLSAQQEVNYLETVSDVLSWGSANSLADLLS